MTTWKISAKWASKRFDCTLHGITKNCHGRCCVALAAYWPPRVFVKASPPHCTYLTPNGCSLSEADRPIDCLLYPLIFNNANTGIVLHNRACLPNWVCKGNYKQGPPLIISLERCLVSMIGRPQYELAKRMVMTGQDATVTPSEDVILHHKVEEILAKLNLPPIPRTQITPETLRNLQSQLSTFNPSPTDPWWKPVSKPITLTPTTSGETVTKKEA